MAVRAEGPTRVLAVTDLGLHAPPSASLLTDGSTDAMWRPWSGPQGFIAAASSEAAVPAMRPVSPTSVQWCSPLIHGDKHCPTNEHDSLGCVSLHHAEPKTMQQLGKRKAF